MSSLCLLPNQTSELDEFQIPSSNSALSLLSSLEHTGLTPDEKLDRAELWVMQNGGEYLDFGTDPTYYQLVHYFTPGLYVRVATSVSGAVVVSRIHKTEHPFIISKGRFAVYGAADGPKFLSAPYFGLTKPGARRFIVTLDDGIWTTFHANPDNCTDVEQLERRLTIESKNLLMSTIRTNRIGTQCR